MQIYLNFSSDQIFSISQTAEITSKKKWQAKLYEFFTKCQARLQFLLGLKSESLSPSKMTKLFPNSPGNYHRPTSGYDQKTITIIVISAQRWSLPEIERGYKSNCRMCRCGNSTLWKCGDVVDPHCQDVEMWWIHIFSVAVHINFEFIQELT